MKRCQIGEKTCLEMCCDHSVGPDIIKHSFIHIVWYKGYFQQIPLLWVFCPLSLVITMLLIL